MGSPIPARAARWPPSPTSPLFVHPRSPQARLPDIVLILIDTVFRVLSDPGSRYVRCSSTAVDIYSCKYAIYHYWLMNIAGTQRGPKSRLAGSTTCSAEVPRRTSLPGNRVELVGAFGPRRDPWRRPGRRIVPWTAPTASPMSPMRSAVLHGEACRSPQPPPSQALWTLAPAPSSVSPKSPERADHEGSTALESAKPRSLLTLGNVPFYSSGSGQDCSQARVSRFPPPRAPARRQGQSHCALTTLPGLGSIVGMNGESAYPPLPKQGNRLQRTVCHLPSESVPTGVETVRKRRCQRSS